MLVPAEQAAAVLPLAQTNSEKSAVGKVWIAQEQLVSCQDALHLSQQSETSAVEQSSPSPLLPLTHSASLVLLWAMLVVWLSQCCLHALRRSFAAACRLALVGLHGCRSQLHDAWGSC